MLHLITFKFQTVSFPKVTVALLLYYYIFVKSFFALIFALPVPPKPRLKALFRFGENLVGQVFQPDVGHCPQYLVTYNPSLPGETSSRIQTLNTGKVISKKLQT